MTALHVQYTTCFDSGSCCGDWRWWQWAGTCGWNRWWAYWSGWSSLGTAVGTPVLDRLLYEFVPCTGSFLRNNRETPILHARRLESLCLSTCKSVQGTVSQLCCEEEVPALEASQVPEAGFPCVEVVLFADFSYFSNWAYALSLPWSWDTRLCWSTSGSGNNCGAWGWFRGTGSSMLLFISALSCQMDGAVFFVINWGRGLSGSSHGGRNKRVYEGTGWGMDVLCMFTSSLKA